MPQPNTRKLSLSIANGFCSDMQAYSEETHTQSTELIHAEYFDVIGSSLKINSPDDFRAWAQNDLQLIFPHGIAFAASATQKASQRIENFDVRAEFGLVYVKNILDNFLLRAGFSSWRVSGITIEILTLD